MRPFIHHNWHVWADARGVLLSDEVTKTLRSFGNIDGVITWLYANGHKEAARALNQHKKGY